MVSLWDICDFRDDVGIVPYGYKLHRSNVAVQNRVSGIGFMPPLVRGATR